MPDGLEELWPRRGRCRSCGRTHVLLPSGLWSRRRYGAAVIMAVLVLAVQAAAAGRAAERPGLDAVSAHEVAGHLSGGLWLAPPVPVLARDSAGARSRSSANGVAPKLDEARPVATWELSAGQGP